MLERVLEAFAGSPFCVCCRLAYEGIDRRFPPPNPVSRRRQTPGIAREAHVTSRSEFVVKVSPPGLVLVALTALLCACGGSKESGTTPTGAQAPVIRID